MLIRKGNRPALVALGVLCGLLFTTCGDLAMKLTITDLAIQYTWEPVTPTPYFKAPTPVANEYFGYSVDISDNFAVVGTLNNKAYVFTNNNGTFTYQTTLTRAGGVTFGYSVAISGNFIVVGDPGYSGGAGTAYLFEYNGSSWTIPTALVGTNGRLECPSSGTDGAGYSVDIDGDYIAIGVPYRNSNDGSIFINYRNDVTPNSWGNQVTLDPVTADIQFGTSVSISGSDCIGGAPYDSITQSNSGAFLQSIRTGISSWSSPVKVKASSPVANANYGFSVSAYNNKYLIGEKGTEKAYLYTRDGSTLSGPYVVSSANSASGDDFGYAVALSDNFCTIGAHLHDTGATDSGTAYIFKNTIRNTENVRITKSAPADSDELGAAVAISFNYVIIGIPSDNDTQTDSGKVVIYRKVRL